MRLCKGMRELSVMGEINNFEMDYSKVFWMSKKVIHGIISSYHELCNQLLKHNGVSQNIKVCCSVDNTLGY